MGQTIKKKNFEGTPRIKSEIWFLAHFDVLYGNFFFILYSKQLLGLGG